MRKIISSLILISAFLFVSQIINAQTAGEFYSRTSGDWSDVARWWYYNGSGWQVADGTTGYPGQFSSPPRVRIADADNYTLDVSPPFSLGTLEMLTGGTDTRITFQGNNVLTVTGATTLEANSNGDERAILVDAGIFTTGSLNLTNSGGNNGTDSYIRISTGSVNVIGDVNMNSTDRRTYVQFTGDGTLYIGGNISGGGITRDANGNDVTSGTVNYNGTGVQTVTVYAYYNLDLSGVGPFNMAGNLDINGFFSTSGQVNTANNITFNGPVSCSGGSINATSGVVTYNAAATNIVAGLYNNLTKTGGGTSTLCGDVTVSNILDLNNGIIQLSNSDLTVSNSAVAAITGTFGVANMIETDGEGMLIKQGTNTGLSIVYPIGSLGYYTPMDLSNGITANYSGTGSIAVRAVSGSQGADILQKYWEVKTTNITSITDVYPLFTYDLAEADASQASYLPLYNPSGTWQAPTNPTGAGIVPFGSTGTTGLAGQWTAGVSVPTIPETYYSYQSGNWNNSSTWTHDPGGTTQTATDIPHSGDNVIILNGRTVSLTANVDSSNLDVTIKEGGIIDQSTFQFSAGIATLRGQGTLMLASVNFPSVLVNLFTSDGGGTTEYYNTASFTLPLAQTEYNNLRINIPGIATQLSNITLNGNLHVKKGTYRINDGSASRRQLTVDGDVLVDNGASLTIGTGNTQSGDISGATTAAPFIDYYDLNSHRVVVYGDFTNNGTVKFTNQTYPKYDAFPNNGMATVYFMGATNNTLYCNGTTDFYNLVLDKGIDQTYKLSVYSTDYPNFRLFGRNNQGGENGGDNPDLRKALWIRTGTLELKGLTIIPSLTEANIGGSPNGDFYIPANAALNIYGSEVIVLSTADNYREVNLAYGVSATSNTDMGILASGGTQSFSVYGKFKIDNGYFSTRESGGIITWDVSSGELEINGGIVDVKQYRSAGTSGGLASFSQSGGTFLLRGRFQRIPTAYSSIANLKDFSTTTLNLTRNTGGLQGNLGTFNINESANVFSMSGGTIKIYDVCGTTENEAFEVFSDNANNNVTGGTIEIIPTMGASGTDATEFLIKTTANLGNLLINRTSSSATVDIDTYDLTVINDLTIASGVLNANDFDISIGGDFTVESGTTYLPGNNWTIFNGLGDQNFTVNTAAALDINKFKIDKSVGIALTLGGLQNTLNVSDSMMIVLGNLDDGGKTINLAGTIATSSYLYNSGVHSGAGKIVMNDNVPQIITGDGNGVFQNIELNNNTGTAPVTLGANTTINGALTFSQDKLFDISTYNLTLGASASIVNVGANRYIKTAGNAGDGGLTRVYSSTTALDFPIGVVNYTPASIGLNAAPTSYGSITIKPVNYEHPVVTASGRSLTYFWRVNETGFDLGAATVNHTYTYSDANLVTGGDVTENGYVAAMYDNTTYTWTKYAASDVDESNNRIGGVGTTLAALNYIDGEFTAGDDDATNPFGTPVVFYSRANSRWNLNTTWSNDPVLKHTGAASGTFPGTNDVVVIGNGNTVNLTTAASCASLQIETGSVLDISLYTTSNFSTVLSSSSGNGLFRLKTTDANAGNRIRLFAFPTGDFSDFNANQGTTEFYSTTSNGSNVYILPANVTSYGNLILSPNGLDNLSLPNNSYTNIYGDLTLNSTTYNSWTTMSWNTTRWGSAAFNPTIEKTVHVHGSFYVDGGSFVFMNDYEPQHLIVDGNIEISSTDGANILILDPAVRGTWVGGTPQANTLQVGGDIINNCSIGIATHPGLMLNSGSYYCDITFTGDGNTYLTNTGGNPRTIFRKVTIDKGTSQADSLIVDIEGTLTTPTDDWLTLQNGTLKYLHDDDLTITEGSQFTIPTTAGLYINSPGNTVYLANDNVNDNDVYLNGKLTILDGDVYIGQTGAPNNNNDIEYSGGGNSEIDIQGGSLTVNGQVRRNPSTSAGVLKYNQSGGDVTINGRNAIAANAKLEILNAGSEFNMSAGTLTIVRGGGNGTFGDLYLRPENSTVTGGEILFAPGGAGAQNFIFDATVPVWDLTIDANANVTLLVSPLQVDGDLTLTTATTSVLDANINFDIPITIKGDFDNSGVYTHRNNVTLFNGGTQQILGSAAIDFYDLTINSLVKLSLNRNANVQNDLILSRGTLECDVNSIYVQGDVTNDATYTDTNSGLVLNGTTQQLIYGTGTFGQLELNNPQGARVEDDITLQKDLVLTKGIFDINDQLVTLQTTSNILGAPFDETKMIASDGVYSNVGISKIFSDTDDGTVFTFPLGTSGKYTPAVLTLTQIGSTGYFRINNINSHHPGVFYPTDVLDYYWEVESSGITGFDGSLVLNYLDDDVQVTSTNTEADYIAAELLLPGSSWSKTDAVDETTNKITFNYSGVNSLTGEYTAGIDTALPDQVPEYTSIDNGNWSDASNWQFTGSGDFYACPAGGPNGFIVTIASDDTITTDANYASAYRITIDGKLKVPGTTYGHNLGTVSGSGILHLESGTFPAGRFANFLDCSNNATLQYGGNTSYALIADLYSTIPNLQFIGSGARVLPNKDLTICNQLLIDGATLDNSVNNRKLTIQGTMERYNSGVFVSGTGVNATVNFEGSSAQTIGGTLGDFAGSNAFNNLEINNSAGLTINSGGDIEVKKNLLLTNGNIITTSSNILKIVNTDINCVLPAGGSSVSYVDGPLIKNINQGDDFLYPIGKGSVLGNKITLSSVRTGTIAWTAEFFNPNPTYTSMSAPLTYVNSKEYWTISAGSGDQAKVGLDWDPASDLTPLMTQNGISDMRVANYNIGATQWEQVSSTSTGNNSNGTVTTSSEITLPASGAADYTTSCVNVTKPRARLNPSGAICGNSGIPVVFTGSALAYDYILTYKKGGVLQPAITITSADVPYTLPTDAIGTTYQLISFTYNEPGSSTTGVVDPTVVITYTLPTTADIGSDGGLDDDNQSICGGTSAVLAGNTPTVGTGEWTVVSGTGGSFVDPTNPTTTFNGTNGTTYTLRWTITNGACYSTDDVVIAFPLLAAQPLAFNAFDIAVCQGQTGVVYTVPNDPTVTYYTWTYSGSGASGYALDTDNSVSIDFDASATSGTLGVTASNGCSPPASLPREIAINVNPIPTITLDDPNIQVCQGGTSVDLVYTATTGTPDLYSINFDGAAETQGFTDVSDAALVASSISITVPGAALNGTYNANLTVTNSGPSCSSIVYPITITVAAIPAPTITGTDTTCVGTTLVYTTESGMNNYVWTVDGSYGNITLGSGTNSITVDWFNYNTLGSPTTISVTYDNAGCIPVSDGELDVMVFKIPETGPQYHIKNDSGL